MGDRLTPGEPANYAELAAFALKPAYRDVKLKDTKDWFRQKWGGQDPELTIAQLAKKVLG